MSYKSIFSLQKRFMPNIAPGRFTINYKDSREEAVGPTVQSVW